MRQWRCPGRCTRRRPSSSPQSPQRVTPSYQPIDAIAWLCAGACGVMTSARALATHPRMLAARCRRQNLVWAPKCVLYSAGAKVWRDRDARPVLLLASGPTPQPRHEQASEAQGGSDGPLALQPRQVWLQGLSAESGATLPCVRCVCGLADGLGYLPSLAMCLGG
jgi:hypothetical protein